MGSDFGSRPGHYYTSKATAGLKNDGKFVRYYNPAWRNVSAATRPLNLDHIRDAFVRRAPRRVVDTDTATRVFERCLSDCG